MLRLNLSLSHLLTLSVLSLSCGLYYKPMTIINDDSWVINKLETSLTDDARVVIYNCHMFIVQATEVLIFKAEEILKLVNFCQ